MNDVYSRLTECLRIAGCQCERPLHGFRPGVGPRCRLCNTVAVVQPAAPQDKKSTKAEALLDEIAISAWQAGYTRAHNDTVEGCYNAGWETDSGAAQEWLDEVKRERSK